MLDNNLVRSDETPGRASSNHVTLRPMARNRLPEGIPWVLKDAAPVGRGGQGDVFRVEPKSGSKFPDGEYALKRLRNVKSAQARDRFQREIEAIARVQHAGVVDIVDVCADDAAESWYYVMPFYGVTHAALDQVLWEDSSPFRGNPTLCANFIASCADALVGVHKAGVVHRDIKPANVLFAHGCEPIIVDFGCCQILDGESVTLVDEAVGTRNYLAPECESGGSETIGPAADLYSLGKLLWVLVTGRQPFARENPAFSGPSSLPKVVPHHPDAWHLTQILERTVRRNPSDRFATAADLAENCRRVATNIIGRFPPLELVHQQCPACGELKPVPRSDKYADVTSQMHMIFGNHSVAGVRKLHCDTCGLIYAVNSKVLLDREKRLQCLE